MPGRKYNLVMVNVDKVKEDLKAMGVTAAQVSEAMGKSQTYVANILGRSSVDKETINKLERALFKPIGTYVLMPEKKDEVEEIDKPPVANEVPKVLTNIYEKLDAIEDVIPVDRGDIINERLQNIEGSLRNMNTWLSRIYAVMTNRSEGSER